ncbi:collagen alpha-1(XIII) chain [Grus japonensis]|uniref:Collagen alpha-1(XIII) chain n=1 Tax=Grus japonensis TaxID=30415 RepID=A0ABC9X479_GRUJA
MSIIGPRGPPGPIGLDGKPVSKQLLSRLSALPPARSHCLASLRVIEVNKDKQESKVPQGPLAHQGPLDHLDLKEPQDSLGQLGRLAEQENLGSLAEMERETLGFRDTLAERVRWVSQACPVLMASLELLAPRVRRDELVTLGFLDSLARRGNLVHRETRDPWAQG